MIEFSKQIAKLSCMHLSQEVKSCNMKKLFIFGGLLVLLIGVFAANLAFADDYALYSKVGDHSKAWDEYVQPGFEAFETNNYPTALVFLQKAYDKGCRDGLVMARLGLVHESRGNTKEAIDLLGQARPKLKKVYPNHEFTQNLDAHLGRMYFSANQYDEALPLLKESLAASPDDFTLLFITGQILREQGKKAEAYELYTRAAKVPAPADVQPDPKKALLKELMAITYEMQRYDEALSYAEQILILAPGDPLAASYKQTITRKQFKKQEDESLQKMIEKYK
jgi:tetratricopeptide (TPR) repeat protein